MELVDLSFRRVSSRGAPRATNRNDAYYWSAVHVRRECILLIQPHWGVLLLLSYWRAHPRMECLPAECQLPTHLHSLPTSIRSVLARYCPTAQPRKLPLLSGFVLAPACSGLAQQPLCDITLFHGVGAAAGLRGVAASERLSDCCFLPHEYRGRCSMHLLR